MSFDFFGFDMRLLSGIRAAGYENPTLVQRKAIPAVLEGSDVMGLAQTGTGKSAAFVLPVLQRLLSDDAGKKGPVRVLVLTPTRELALQIHETFIVLGKQTGIRSAAVHGGVGFGRQLKDIKKVTVVTACPGRLLDLMERGEVDLTNVDTLVLDEADRMLDMGFLTDVQRVLDALPARRQNLMFSATMPETIAEFSTKILNDPVVVKVAHTVPADGVDHVCCPVPVHLKQSFLKALLDETEFQSVLIFVRTKRWAGRLAQRLMKSGFRAVDLHGDLSQSKRRRALDGFKNGEFNVLVATDLAARGIDCSGISHVINYDMPDTVEIYVHRIGRTGRVDRKGVAFTFVAVEDQIKMEEIEDALGSSLKLHYLDSFNYSAPKTDFSAVDKSGAAARQKGPRSKAGKSFSKK
ncbi:DEAD/DEAH box helicase [Maridesulfovibrio hydrothermalis]|uniref:ATP-dependent RNA helicase rhlE n=1 Tax=Maridesulfovibrio hydrothermalis AM13 = DSM 14728 TaxID=1121451 RepID=L0RCH1_9BACT|nr:DEAD/DEAH box helicase [Maridesulfovibrio hydrothermalis]CCO23902.1 ATP-dependent RNA helicase rhlE [Maridesulfovibrio hydrothermalis AM13 = DSM 14728]